MGWTPFCSQPPAASRWIAVLVTSMLASRERAGGCRLVCTLAGLAWKNKRFKRYLSIRYNIHWAINFRFLLLIWHANCEFSKQFWDFRIPPFIKIKKPLQILPPSEETCLEREFVLKLFILFFKDLINCQLFIKLTTPLQFLYDP